jgi:Icc-related predicted phosphoesterase
MQIVCTSDLHGRYPEIPPCDLVIVAGDVTPFFRFGKWVQELPVPVVWIAGNHDVVLEGQELAAARLPTYLCDSGTTAKGLTIYGSPWTPPFNDWAFNASESELEQRFVAIPERLDILITHGPPYGILDRCMDGSRVGSVALLERLKSLRHPPKYHIFGHIHESYGSYKCPTSNTQYLNVAHVDTRHQPRNPPVLVTL